MARAIRRLRDQGGGCALDRRRVSGEAGAERADQVSAAAAGEAAFALGLGARDSAGGGALHAVDRVVCGVRRAAGALFGGLSHAACGPGARGAAQAALSVVRRGGAEALRGVGRPRAGERVAALVERPRLAVAAGVAVPDELAQARERIAALERKIGQQALELDFFGQALQLMEQAGRRSSGLQGAPASTASSRPGRGGTAG